MRAELAVPERCVEAGGEGEVPEEVGGELHLPALGSESPGGKGHDPGVGDEDVERAVPRPREGVDGRRIGQVESRGPHLAPATEGGELAGERLGGLRTAGGDRDMRTGGGERPDGLGADARAAARDHGVASGEIHAVDDLRGGGVVIEGGCEERVGLHGGPFRKSAVRIDATAHGVDDL